jgi:hypothetical protein
MIVSVSRRCDIPRFQFDWFMERVGEGFVDVANPYNARQIKRVSLLPLNQGEAGQSAEEGVEAFVFWTRDPRPILANVDEMTGRGFCFYVMVTVTGYPDALEPNPAPAAEVIAAMQELARKIGQDRVIWRYDPVLLSSVTGDDFHRRNFRETARSLAGSVRRVIISIYDEYRETRMRLFELERTGKLRMPDAGSDLSGMLADMAKSAADAGMEIQSCAEKEDYSLFGISPGACVDAALIRKLFCLELSGKDRNQRPCCLCCKSVDIGAYGTCEARCVYCYAWR